VRARRKRLRERAGKTGLHGNECLSFLDGASGNGKAREQQRDSALSASPEGRAKRVAPAGSPGERCSSSREPSGPEVRSSPRRIRLRPDHNRTRSHSCASAGPNCNPNGGPRKIFEPATCRSPSPVGQCQRTSARHSVGLTTTAPEDDWEFLAIGLRLCGRAVGLWR
jgi:hypothetical protein